MFQLLMSFHSTGFPITDSRQTPWNIHRADYRHLAQTVLNHNIFAPGVNQLLLRTWLEASMKPNVREGLSGWTTSTLISVVLSLPAQSLEVNWCFFWIKYFYCSVPLGSHFDKSLFSHLNGHHYYQGWEITLHFVFLKSSYNIVSK